MHHGGPFHKMDALGGLLSHDGTFCRIVEFQWVTGADSAHFNDHAMKINLSRLKGCCGSFR
jgi:hypothetical protein